MPLRHALSLPNLTTWFPPALSETLSHTQRDLPAKKRNSLSDTGGKALPTSPLLVLSQAADPSANKTGVLSLSDLHIVLAAEIYNNFELVSHKLPEHKQCRSTALKISEQDEKWLVELYETLEDEPAAVYEPEFHTASRFLEQQGLDWRELLNVAWERNFEEWEPEFRNARPDPRIEDSQKVPGAEVITICIPVTEALARAESHAEFDCADNKSSEATAKNGKSVHWEIK